MQLEAVCYVTDDQNQAPRLPVLSDWTCWRMSPEEGAGMDGVGVRAAIDEGSGAQVL